MDSVPPALVGRAQLLHEADVPPHLIVKFGEATMLSDADSLAFVAAHTEQVFQDIAGTRPIPPPTRALVSVPVDELDDLVARARTNAAQDMRELPDLRKFYSRQVPDLSVLTLSEAISATERLLEVVGTILASPLVEAAYIESPAVPPPTTVDFANETNVANQVYLEAAPNGVGCIALWRMAPDGCDGRGVRFVDVEGGWRTDHDDLTRLNAWPIFGYSKSNELHGTKVLGVINAVENDSGIIGAAPAASGSLSSEYHRSGTGTEVHSVPNALFQALSFLTARDKVGDVIVVEAQVAIVDTNGIRAFLPVEAEYLNWAVIAYAYFLGVVVVEAAGNGDRKINIGGIGNLPPGTFDFLDANRHSRAIIVAAGMQVRAVVAHVSRFFPEGWAQRFPIFQRMTYVRYGSSNYGSRVDCFARADRVYTCDQPPSGYSDQFDDTSAATAIVAGVAIVTQALAARKVGGMLKPPELRSAILQTPGTPSRAGSGIRSMPDLVRIYHALRISLRVMRPRRD